ncbi:MAG: hypothetical protein M3209_09820 [Acidobacteriota bacterium]|nr:hypothetical protein [Acidobacteriota bacterium]
MSNEQIVEFLETIAANDRSPKYEYGEPRQFDGKCPPAGARWATPREIAAELKQKLCAEILLESPAEK